MKTKFLLIVLCTILLSMTVSAVDLIDATTPSTLTKSKAMTSFDITSKVDNVTLSMVKDIVAIEDNEGKKLTVTITPDTLGSLLTTGDKVTVNIQTNVDSEFDFNDVDYGKYTIATLTLNATDVNTSETEQQTITVYFVNGFCTVGSVGDLEIIEVKDKEVDNEDAWDWKPLDDIQFRVEVGNNFDEKKRITVKYEIYNEGGRKVKFDESNDQSVSIDSGDAETLTFDLRIPADMDDGNYKLFVKAYVKSHEDDEGCVDNADSEELNRVYYQEVTVNRDESRAVVIDTDKIDVPDSTLCGDFATVYVKIYNIGEEDEDRVLVNLFNKNLNININEVISDLGKGDSEIVTFNFQIPENVKEENRIFKLTTFYEYDEDQGDPEDIAAYDSNSDDDLGKTFNFNLKVNCLLEKKVSVKISVDSEQEYDAVAGQEVTVKVNVENTGNETIDLSIQAEGFESWATEKKVVPRLLNLKAGESKEVSITLSVDADIEEADWQTFSVQALSEGKLVADKELEIFVDTASSTAPVTGDVIANHFRENWFIWVIIIINVVLIIAIILVARRIVTAK